jgi:hypothetical protein
MSEEEFNMIIEDTVKRMTEYVRGFVTPICFSREPGDGTLVGTGSFFQYNGRVFVVTNSHVVFDTGGHPTGHKLEGLEEIYRFTKDALCIDEGRDVAICEVSADIWALGHKNMAISSDMFCERHQPVEGELLFFVGYPGDRSKLVLQHLFTPPQQYLTQEIIPQPPDTLAFALHHNTEKSTRVDGSTQALPLPNGMSGSLVWNTRRIEFLAAGRPWEPRDALVTGLMQRWKSGDVCLRATRIEETKLFGLAAMYP